MRTIPKMTVSNIEEMASKKSCSIIDFAMEASAEDLKEGMNMQVYDKMTKKQIKKLMKTFKLNELNDESLIEAANIFTNVGTKLFMSFFKDDEDKCIEMGELLRIFNRKRNLNVRVLAGLEVYSYCLEQVGNLVGFDRLEYVVRASDGPLSGAINLMMLMFDVINEVREGCGGLWELFVPADKNNIIYNRIAEKVKGV